MTPKMKEFLSKLADLMEEYDAGFEVTEELVDYNGVTLGLDIEIGRGILSNWSCVSFDDGCLMIDSEDIKQKINELT